MRPSDRNARLPKRIDSQGSPNGESEGSDPYKGFFTTRARLRRVPGSFPFSSSLQLARDLKGILNDGVDKQLPNEILDYSARKHTRRGPAYIHRTTEVYKGRNGRHDEMRDEKEERGKL